MWPDMRRPFMFTLFLMITMLKLFLVVVGEPKSTPYFQYCYRENPPLQYHQAINTAISNLIESVSNNWDKRRETNIRRPKGPFVKVRGMVDYTYDDEYESQCITKQLYWNGGCRESPTCLSSGDCAECLTQLASNLVKNLCPNYYRARAHAIDCFAHYTNLEIMPPPRDEVEPLWPANYE